MSVDGGFYIASIGARIGAERRIFTHNEWAKHAPRATKDF